MVESFTEEAYPYRPPFPEICTAPSLPAVPELQTQALQALGNQNGEGLVLTDALGRIVSVNIVAERMLGWNAKEMIGQPCRRLLHCQDANTLGQSHASCRNASVSSNGDWIRRTLDTADGHHKKIVARSSNLFGPNGPLLGVLCTFKPENRDGQLDTPGAELLSNVSHELRTPLSALAFSIEVLSSTHGDMSYPEIDRILKVIHYRTLQLHGLVENLLSSSSIQLGCLNIHPQFTDVSTVIDDAVDFAQLLLEKKQQRLRKIIDDGLPPVLIDQRRILQVMINLLSNANKYAPEGDEIRIEVRQENRSLKISVHEDGPGIPAEEKNNIFERFYRSRRSGQMEPQGMGLGLALVKSIIVAHGGRVGVESELGAGSTFWFTLPISRKGGGGLEKKERPNEDTNR